MVIISSCEQVSRCLTLLIWQEPFCHHCYIVIYSIMQHHNDTIIDRRTMINDAVINDAHRKTQEDFFIKYFTSHFICKVSKRVTQSLHVRGSWKTEHNWNILTPKLWPSALCLSRSPWLLNRSPGIHCPGCWLSLLHLVYLWLQLYC